MNFQEPYRIHQINFDNLSFNKIKTVYNTNNTIILKKIITIKYNDKNVQKPLVIQIPTLLNENLPMKAKDYHDLEIPLITEDKNKVVNLINFFENLDNKIISEAKKNSKLWFDKIPSKNCVKYKRIIKDSDRYKDGVLRLKIIKKLDFETLLQIENKKRINISEIPSNTWCKILLEIFAIVINYETNSFSLFLRPIVLSFKEKEIIKYNYKILDDTDSDKDDIPDTEFSSVFMKQNNKERIDDKNVTSSQVNIVSTIKDMLNSSTSSDEDDEISDSQPEYIPETTQVQPVETKPVETKQPETKQPETKQPETKPVETKPVENKPVENKPVETKPVENKPVETKPVESKQVETNLEVQPKIIIEDIETKTPETKQSETKTLELTSENIEDTSSEKSDVMTTSSEKIDLSDTSN